MDALKARASSEVGVSVWSVGSAECSTTLMDAPVSSRAVTVGCVRLVAQLCIEAVVRASGVVEMEQSGVDRVGCGDVEGVGGVVAKWRTGVVVVVDRWFATSISRV